MAILTVSKKIQDMRFLLIVSIFLLGFTGVFSQNIMISDVNFPEEPAIIINPLKPNELLAASNINNYYISLDTGRTWTSHFQSSSLGVWGDPVLDVDTNGHYYYFHLANPPSPGNFIDRIVCQKSTDVGQTWTDGSFTGLDGTKAQDKHWSIIDRTNNHIYLTWTQFDDYGSSNPNCESKIMFSKSTDGAVTWTPAIAISHTVGDCVDSDNTMEGAVPALGPSGELYVSWAGPEGLYFNRSVDEGSTWWDQDSIISDFPGGWEFAIPGIYRANGLPITKCDLSPGPHKGTIYVNWVDKRNGDHDTDVWLIKSKDGGLTWTDPIRVNDDGPDKHQFFTWMAIDQVTGFLYFVFYDRRHHEDTSTDVYLAISEDGGATFSNHLISESPFIPNPGVFFGDYNNIVAHDGIVRPIWTRLHNAKLSVWTDITPLDSILTGSAQVLASDQVQVMAYPNPAADMAHVSFKLRSPSAVSLAVIDGQGNLVKQVLHHEHKPIGKYVIPIGLSEQKLPAGTYYYTLTINQKSKTKKLVIH